MYVMLGAYIVPDAQRLLDAFVKEDIRFDIARDETAVKRLTLVQARLHGGTGGHGIRIAIAVHQDDHDRATRLAHDLLSILP